MLGAASSIYYRSTDHAKARAAVLAGARGASVLGRAHHVVVRGGPARAHTHTHACMHAQTNSPFPFPLKTLKGEDTHRTHL